jgi:hypothetical protein
MNSNKKICIFMSKVYAKAKRVWRSVKIINDFIKIRFILAGQKKQVEDGTEKMSNSLPPF